MVGNQCFFFSSTSTFARQNQRKPRHRCKFVFLIDNSIQIYYLLMAAILKERTHIPASVMLFALGRVILTQI